MQTRTLGYISVYNDLAVETDPHDRDEWRAFATDCEDDTLREHGHDPDTLDPLTRADLLHEITTAEMERLTA